MPKPRVITRKGTNAHVKNGLRCQDCFYHKAIKRPGHGECTYTKLLVVNNVAHPNIVQSENHWCDQLKPA